MSYRHVALIGAAGSGKDTVGARLIERFAFVRVAFADPVRALALDLDPIICTVPGPYGPVPLRLSHIVGIEGWDRAKQRREVRRTLQHVGQSLRDRDPEVWVRPALDKIATADRWSLPIVVTDVRYLNEARALRQRGALLVRIERPGDHDHQADPEAQQHRSETELATFPADAVLTNGGSLAELYDAADRLAVRR
ncbi:deoxynucleotide monophosphate kinase family protein [Streptomyces tsukubensis]